MENEKNVHKRIEEFKKEGVLKVDQFNMPYMDEMDPENPYGPNYCRLSYTTKKYYKFLKVKQYVHMSGEDSTLLRQADVGLYGGMGVGLVGGLVLAKGTSAYLQKHYPTSYLNKFCIKNPHLYFGFLGALCATETYWQLAKYYNSYVIDPLYQKYLDTAIQNGFQNYNISHYQGYQSITLDTYTKQ